MGLNLKGDAKIELLPLGDGDSQVVFAIFK